jgi:hypothetical protein
MGQCQQEQRLNVLTVVIASANIEVEHVRTMVVLPTGYNNHAHVISLQ